MQKITSTEMQERESNLPVTLNRDVIRSTIRYSRTHVRRCKESEPNGRYIISFEIQKVEQQI